ncbi:MAG: methylcobamide--CoM methyltransferase [Firmicutes bacterium]|nr:methylcobamide--CoM methyltransferase [Bacillota bacterium]
MDPVERLNAAVRREPLDRPPCICPGGMMNMMFGEIMEKTGCLWPAAHSDPVKMAGLCQGLYEAGGFENYGVPFDMTVEAEALGARVDMGDLLCEPHITRSVLASPAEYPRLKALDPSAGRIPCVLEAVRLLKKRGDGVPVIGNITGPISLAGMLVDMEKLLPAMRRDPESVSGLLDFVCDQLVTYGRLLKEAGADAVCLSDPSGTGEVVGPRFFRTFTVPAINRVLDSIDIPVKMVHICGRLQSVYDQLADIRCDVFSFDAIVPVEEVRKHLPDRALMGNVSTLAMQEMSDEKVRSLVLNARRQGVDIVAPACGLPTTAPLHVIRSLVSAAKETI